MRLSPDDNTQAFARFYFISNDELLQILSQSRDPTAVQPFLRKCFDALASLEFISSRGSPTQLHKGTGSNHRLPKASAASLRISAMVSGDGERIEFQSSHLRPAGAVEKWLGGVEAAMQKTLKALLKAGMAAQNSTRRSEWIKQHPGQVVATASQIKWTAETIAAIEAATLAKWFQRNVKQVNHACRLHSSCVATQAARGSHIRVRMCYAVALRRRSCALAWYALRLVPLASARLDATCITH